MRDSSPTDLPTGQPHESIVSIKILSSQISLSLCQVDKNQPAHLCRDNNILFYIYSAISNKNAKVIITYALNQTKHMRPLRLTLSPPQVLLRIFKQDHKSVCSQDVFHNSLVTYYYKNPFDPSNLLY